METRSCIYCGRSVVLNELLERAGTYRCKDEDNCLAYQTREDPADAAENADYLSGLVKSSLTRAAERVAAYTRTTEDPAKGGATENPAEAAEPAAEFVWMKSAAEMLASEYSEKSNFVFRYDATTGAGYEVAWNDAARDVRFTVRIDQIEGAGYALVVASPAVSAGEEPLYREFIYKTYPSDQKEDVVKDLAVILAAFEAEAGLTSGLLRDFRAEVEARGCGDVAESF